MREEQLIPNCTLKEHQLLYFPNLKSTMGPKKLEGFRSLPENFRNVLKVLKKFKQLHFPHSITSTPLKLSKNF